MNKRLIDYHIARLKDKRPEVRLEAIHQLVLLEAVDALGVLKQLYETDPDLEVKKAAQEAGRQIFIKSRQKQVNRT